MPLPHRVAGPVEESRPVLDPVVVVGSTVVEVGDGPVLVESTSPVLEPSVGP